MSSNTAWTAEAGGEEPQEPAFILVAPFETPFLSNLQFHNSRNGNLEQKMTFPLALSFSLPAFFPPPLAVLL